MEPDPLPSNTTLLQRAIDQLNEGESQILASNQRQAASSPLYQFPDALQQERQGALDNVQSELNSLNEGIQSYNTTITTDINQFLGSSYPDSFIPTGPTVPGTPSATATKPDLTVPPDADTTQSVGPLGDVTLFGVGDYNDAIEGTKQALYDNAVSALSPIGNSLGGAASAIVGAANSVVNTLTSTVNSVVGAITDVLSGKILTDAVSGLMSTAEKFVAMVGQAAYQNVMGFLESFKMVENIFNAAANIASDIGQTVKKAASDIAGVLSKDWDKLSWPDVNWDRIKSCFDTETFSKIGEGISNFFGNTKLPIGLSLNQISDLTKNLELKETLLKQVEDVKSGVTKLGTQALESLYAQVAAVNNAILAITNLPNSLTSMFNGLVNRLDPLKERQANKVIMDYIKKGKVIKDETTVDL